MSNDELRINIGPMKNASRRAVTLLGVSFAGAGMIVLMLLGLTAYFAATAFVWWLSDLAYDIGWLLGLPIRLLGVFMFISFLFLVLGVLMQILAVIVVAVRSMFSAAR